MANKPLYRIALACPRCGKTSEHVGTLIPKPHVNCGDCLMERVEIIEMVMEAAEQIRNAEEALALMREIDLAHSAACGVNYDPTMHDPTESTRRTMLAEGQPARDLEQASERWTPEELARDFIVHGFMAPLVIVTRKADGVKGSLQFVHSPRVYFGFQPE